MGISNQCSHNYTLFLFKSLDIRPKHMENVTYPWELYNKKYWAIECLTWGVYAYEKACWVWIYLRTAICIACSKHTLCEIPLHMKFTRNFKGCTRLYLWPFHYVYACLSFFAGFLSLKKQICLNICWCWKCSLTSMSNQILAVGQHTPYFDVSQECGMIG